MSWFSELIKAQGQSGESAYKTIRFSLSILSPLFIMVGLLGSLDKTLPIFSNGSQIYGLERLIVTIGFILIGIIFGILRLSIFKEKTP